MEVGLSGLTAPYDLIIIGTGPAGLTLARKYEELTGHKTLLIESGPRSQANSDAQKLALVDAIGDLGSAHYSLHNQRVFGGTSRVWHGWCAVLEKRAFLNNEWPLFYEDIYRYYPEAASILSVPDLVYTHPETPFPDANIIYKPYYFSPPTRFNESFSDWVASNANVHVLFNHSVTGINIESGAATSVFVRGASGGRMVSVEIASTKTVLAAGGIQNAYLLKLSLPEDTKLPIGKFFCEHPHIYGAAQIILDKEKYEKIRDKRKDRIVPALALSSEISNQHSLKSATFEISGDHDISVNNILGQKRETITATTNIRAEMSPHESNKISLSGDCKNFLGQPVARVNLKFEPEEIRASHEVLNTELTRSGIGRLSALPREFSIHGGGHMMGTTRMGVDPNSSVTDPHGRVHGIENLYVVGSSLFPSVGAANPTLTIVALSLRMADYLERTIE